MESVVTIIQGASLLVAIVIFIAAAISDVRSYRIPNYLCGLLLLLYPIYALTAPPSLDWRQNFIVFAVVSFVGFAAFWAQILGAGDVKLLSAASLWAGPQYIAILLVVTAFAGGLESIVMVAQSRFKPAKSKKAQRLAKIQIPYGVALATGGVAMLGLMSRPILASD